MKDKVVVLPALASEFGLIELKVALIDVSPRRWTGAV
jgi:hypothetical protein